MAGRDSLESHSCQFTQFIHILGCENIVDNTSNRPSTQASSIPMNELEGG